MVWPEKCFCEFGTIFSEKMKKIANICNLIYSYFLRDGLEKESEKATIAWPLICKYRLCFDAKQDQGSRMKDYGSRILI